MTAVTIMSKQPPGGRCSLYMRYAETLRRELGVDVEVRYCGDGTEVQPPAILIDETPVAPSDGVIVSPQDIAQSLRQRLREPEVANLSRLLETTLELWMEEWSGD